MQQLSLWENIGTQNVSVLEVAKQLQVSLATIHNWIKIGYLRSSYAQTVTRDSVDLFIAQYIGQTKLVSRVNKLHKSNAVQVFDIENYKGTDVSSDYEASLSEAYRNQEGIYYTPQHIVQDMLKGVSVSNDATFLEPCCGSGNFVAEAINMGINPKNIYAFDTDKNAVEITHQRIFQMTGYDSPNIICADFLQLCPTLHRKFDYIYTNPPWGKKLSKDSREQYADTYNAGSSKDTCALFYYACLSVLKKDGRMGMLLPEAFFSVATYEMVRKKTLSLSVRRLTDYGKAFGGIMTRAVAIELDNTCCNDDSQLIICQTTATVTKRSIHSFSVLPKNVFNLHYSEQEAKLVEHIYSLPHTTLKGNACWGLGIVTGNNKEKCSTTQRTGYVPVFRGKDIAPNVLACPSLYIDEKLENCQQVAPLHLYHAKEKLIYRFISDKLVFYCDREQRYILNSANMLVLNEAFPLTSEQVADIMNSKFMNWLFHMLFATHKVLRSDLEQLPIFVTYFQAHKHFNEAEYLDFINIEEQDGTYRIKR